MAGSMTMRPYAPITAHDRRPWLTRLVIVLGVLAISYLFRWAYIEIVYPLTAYYGFLYTPLSLNYELLNFALLLVIACALPATLTRPSHMLCWILMILVVIPNITVLLYIVPPSQNPGILGFELSMCLGFLLILLAARLPHWRLPGIPIPEKTFYAVLVALCVAISLCLIAVFHGSMHLVSLMEVYEQRALFKEATSPIFTYLLCWQGYVIAPLVFLHALRTKNIPLMIFAMATQVMTFTIGGHKAFLFFIPYTLLLWAVIGDKSSKNVMLFVGIFVLLFLGIYLQHNHVPVIIEILMNAFLLVRLFAMSAYSSAAYILYFTENPFTYFSHIRGFNLIIPTQYSAPDVSIPDMIGKYATGFNDVLNCHFWADGYACDGPLGVVVISLLVAGIFLVIDYLALRKDTRIVLTLIGLHGSVLANSSIFTWLVTEGGVLICLLLFFMPNARATTRAAADAPRAPDPVDASPPLVGD